MKKYLVLHLLLMYNMVTMAAFEKTRTTENNFNIIELSQQLLLAAKTNEPTDSLVNVVKTITADDLSKQLSGDAQKKAFWINLYNAYTQISLHKNPDQYKDRGSFFGEKMIEINGTRLSLDDVEHGLLRRSKVKWSLGHLNKLFPNSFEKKQRVNTVDYRIHFALNCGAKSCPPIAFYSPAQLDKQLDLATSAYLHGDAEYKEDENAVYLPAIMGWFRGDFGGKKHMMALLKKLNIVPADKKPDIKFSKYNWDLFLANYKTE